MRYPGEPSLERFFRRILDRLVKLERGDYWRNGTLQAQGVRLGPYLVTTQQSDDPTVPVDLVVRDPANGRTGSLTIIWHDEEE